MAAKTIVYIDGFNFNVRRRARLRDTIDREIPAPAGAVERLTATGSKGGALTQSAGSPSRRDRLRIARRFIAGRA